MFHKMASKLLSLNVYIHLISASSLESHTSVLSHQTCIIKHCRRFQEIRDLVPGYADPKFIDVEKTEEKEEKSLPSVDQIHHFLTNHISSVRMSSCLNR